MKKSWNHVFEFLWELCVKTISCLYLTLIPPIFFVLKMTSAANIQVNFRLDFINEANTMNPDQTAPWGAV